jgi:hypothetical protein
VTPQHELFTITEKGMGKRTPFEEYRVTNRGGQGVRNYAITPKTGKVVASRTVNSRMELIVISRDGIVIRTRMDSIRPMGRATQGVSVINVGPGDAVASLATIDMGGGANGNGGGGAPKGPEGTQPPLEGISASTEGAAPKKGAARKPTPIRGRSQQRPKPMQARPAAKKPAAKAPARKPASKPKASPKSKPKPKRR